MRVLIVTYHFPPDGEIGAVRPYQLARHLPEQGIEPWILTVDPAFAETPDLGLAHEGVPSQHVIRTAVDRTHRDFLLGVLRRLSRKSPRQPLMPASSGGGAPPTSSPAVVRSGIRDRMLAWLTFPDSRIGWYRPAIRAGSQLLGSLPFDALLTTSPPRVAHLVGAHLSTLHGLPWLMDFRDPWYMDWTRSAGAAPVMQTVHRWLFRRTARRAQAIVANSEPLLQHLLDQLLTPPTRARCIPNGYDISLAEDSEEKQNRELRIGYFGQIMGRRSAVPFLEGLRLWQQRSAVKQGLVQVLFTGDSFQAERRATEALGLGQLVRFEAAVPRESALQLMGQQWLLLLLANDQPLQIPGKTYEYLATGRRILALTEPQSATAVLLTGVDGCAVASTSEEVAVALDRFCEEHQSGQPGVLDRRQLLAMGTFRRRAEAFAAILHELVLARR